MTSKVNPEIQKVMTQRLEEIVNNLRAAGFKEREISKSMKAATREVLIEISKELQKEKFAKIKSEDEI